ncbi:uncharacterized protein SPAPADRAFT_67579 [Spathaspora passalidarum NRRL Y-27907]|uniref:Uncharacterized protein n=1 Tax=Spathaspora passalidarum (strain NRRL Y-27907 / 11-Y1) TaxID=619300 RepID=G3AQI3_SPAPN|nr:uncharacterized protein SPAPADRAFT_67579 [Spathaspora passalidarum NRRL Y-27907]EGW31530.1 hypothetical protein SPAPADRAFT_67579 [Spathaspora passalidarum NRRL Y-27907]
MNCLLDLYPVEVLAQIFNYARIENIIQWTDKSHFLHDNQNIKAAFDYALGNSKLSFNNRMRQPSLFLKYLQDHNTYVDKRELHFVPTLSRLQTAIEYCSQENIQTTVTLSYYVWSLEDICELLDFLNPHSQLKYNIEIEFKPGLLYDVNLNEAFDTLSDELRSKIISITIINYSGSLHFDIDKFSNLQDLWQENSNVSLLPSFNSRANLRTVKLFPNLWGWNNNHGVYLQRSLPHDLEKVVLGNCVIQESSHVYPIPQNVKSIHLTKLKDQTPESQYAKSLIEQNLENLQELSVQCMWNGDDEMIDVNDILFNNQENFQRLKQLQSFAISGLNFPINLEQSNLKSVTISSVPSVHIFDHSVLPATLKNVNLSRNNIVDIRAIDKILPSNLEVLIIAENPINWVTYIPNFKRFPQLKVLNLTNTLVGENLEDFELSDSIEELSLENNQIISIEKVVFPRNLHTLYLGCNLITTVVRPHFPTCLKEVYFTDNSISGYLELSKNHAEEDLQIEVLYLNYNELERFEDVHLPKTLNILNFDYCYFTNLSDYTFSASIRELSFTGCEIDIIRNISWEPNSQLKHISLAQNKLQKVDWKFPASVETINLSGNRINYIDPSTFNSLYCLRNLNISANKLETFDHNFNIKCIRVLDLSFNHMKTVNISFPRNCNTELRILNLSSNKLNKLNAFSIGHDRDLTFHDKLLEIDINGNRIRARDIENDKWHFPASLKCLFMGYTRNPDKFGYDVGKSIINNKLCMGKKIDVPSIA